MDAAIGSSLAIANSIRAKTNKSIFLRFPVIKEFFLYGIIGSFSAGVDSFLFWILRKQGMVLFAANFIGINMGICSSFLLNTFFNFKAPQKLLRRGIKFFAVGYLGLLLSMFILHTGVIVLELRDIYVKIVSVFIVALIQFILNKLFTFRETER
ncbi:MAG: GtrA family protein [Treponema sp.]|nr:GtrA family protein [Treponema sp.]